MQEGKKEKNESALSTYRARLTEIGGVAQPQGRGTKGCSKEKGEDKRCRKKKKRRNMSQQ